MLLRVQRYVSNGKIISAISVGTILEFYDFALFGFMVPALGPLFFPSVDPFVTLLMGFGAFAISFVVRPLGGLIFGVIGDFYGRKKALCLSLLLTSTATTAIGCLPTYAEWGALATCALLALRVVQGLCLGGEYTGALISATELQGLKDRRPALYSSLVSSAGVSGWFLAILVCRLCSQDDMPDYMWRIPFLTGALVGGIGLFLRRYMVETLPQNGVQNPAWTQKSLRSSHFRTVAAIAGVGVCMGAYFYGIFIFPNGYLPLTTQIDKTTLMACTSVGIGTYMICLPVMGWVADKIGRSSWMKLSTVCMFFASPFLIVGIMSGHIAPLLLSEIVAGFLLAGFMAPAMSIVVLAVSPNVRYRQVSISYNVGASLVGGTGPVLCLFLITSLKTPYAPILYLVFCSAVGFIATYFLNEKH